MNGVVYGFADGLYAWNASNGQVIWRNPAYQAGALVVSHGKVYVPYGYIAVLDASSGHFLHVLGRPGIYDLLAANNTTLYLQGSTGLQQSTVWKNKNAEELLAFRLSNDTLLWQRTLTTSAALFSVTASSMYLGDDAAAQSLPLSQEHINATIDLYSLRASDGSQQWHWHDSVDDPIAGGLGVVSAFEVNGVVCLSTANGIYGFQARTGKLLWHIFQGESMQGPVFQGESIESPIGA